VSEEGEGASPGDEGTSFPQARAGANFCRQRTAAAGVGEGCEGRDGEAGRGGDVGRQARGLEMEEAEEGAEHQWGQMIDDQREKQEAEPASKAGLPD
jgi:hypothetical protein